MSVCAARPLGWTLKVSKGVFLLCFPLLELPEVAEGWTTSHTASLASSLADNAGRCEEAAEEALWELLLFLFLLQPSTAALLLLAVVPLLRKAFLLPLAYPSASVPPFLYTNNSLLS